MRSSLHSMLERAGFAGCGKQDEDEVSRLAERMRRLLGPFVLRRLKQEVMAQLAPKTQRLESVRMAPQQAALYAQALRELRSEVAAGDTATGGAFDSA
jgi:SNF2 family DNA or RNA helicase